ncbi:hypothetical protein [Nocardioides sp.]|uniref:hypothetical protein n=1 Tax=Nocardioides sp. TaxID=35761 RepID=UPI0039E6CF7B
MSGEQGSNQHWAIIRQVVIGAEDGAATAKELCETFGLPDGFPDPELADIGLADETIRVGRQAHLEVVSPLRPDVSLQRWIERGGGPGGYCLSVQVPDVAARIAAAEAAGVGLAADVMAMGRHVIQLKPGDMGLLVEFDEIPDPDVWFWDDVVTAEPDHPLVDDVLAVEIASPDPHAQAELWSTVWGFPLQAGSAGPEMRIGSRVVRFVEGPRRMLSAVDLAATPAGEPMTTTIGGVEFRVL